MICSSILRSYEFESKFRFFCENHKYFVIDLVKVPDEIPEKAECPKCGVECELSYPAPRKGSTTIRDSSYRQRFWSKEENRRAYAESFQKSQIEESKARLEGQKGISPYSKYELDYEYFQEQGVLKRVSTKEAIDRAKFSQTVAKSVEGELSEDELQRVGKRTDG
jgi:Na+-translocating ferredoxin:NAD+ oxidoreductase RnfC subunit